MSKKFTALLIIFLLTLILYNAVKIYFSTKTESADILPRLSIVQPASESILSFQPNLLTVEPGKQASVDIMIETQSNQSDLASPYLIQLELGYDPKILTNVNVLPGNFSTEPVELLNIVNEHTGRISFAVKSANKDLEKNGIVATISFTPLLIGLQKESEIYFLQKTTVKTSEGTNILKAAHGAKITVSPNLNTQGSSSTAIR